MPRIRSENDPYLGNRYGVFEIIEVAAEKANDGHKQYVGQCIRCGALRTSKIDTFIRKPTTICNHLNAYGAYTAKTDAGHKWENKRLH